MTASQLLWRVLISEITASQLELGTLKLGF